MRRRARGIMGLAVLSLGLGVVTTYGVAWWLMNSTRFAPQYGAIQGALGNEWSVHAIRRDGVTWVTGCGMLGLGSSRLRELPEWSVTHRMKPSEVIRASGQLGFDPVFLVERGAGWPFVAVVERRCDGSVWSNGRIAPVRGADLSIRWDVSPTGSERVLALMPAWPGFLVDVVCFAVPWVLAVLMVSEVRRRTRVRAGRCVECRYDLKGLKAGVCPECGTAVKGRE